MKKILLFTLLGLSACKSSTDTPSTQSQSGYLGMWYERWATSDEAFTLDFTGPTECTISQGSESWSPATMFVGATDSLEFNEGNPLGVTMISMSWPSAGGLGQPPSAYISVYLNRAGDSLLALQGSSTIGYNFTR